MARFSGVEGSDDRAEGDAATVPAAPRPVIPFANNATQPSKNGAFEVAVKGAMHSRE